MNLCRTPPSLKYVSGAPGDACYKNPLCSLLRTLASANSWLAEPWWVTHWRVSWRVLVRDKHHEGIKEMCSTGISFGWSKLYTLIMYQRHVKTRTGTNSNSLFSRQRFSGGFVYWICPNTERRFKVIAILARHLQCRYSQERLFRKNIYLLEWTIVASKSRVCKERAEALVKKPIRWAFWQLFIILLSLFVSQVTGDCSVLCDHSLWWGKTKGLVYSHETDHCLS